MASYIFEFTHEDHRIVMYRDDEGMYRVYLWRTGADGKTEDILIGALENRNDAAFIFNAKVQRITSAWEREDR